MKHKVIVKPIKEDATDTFMPTIYTVAGGDVRVLLENDEFSQFNQNKDTVPKAKQIVFRNTLRALTFEYESDESKQNSTDRKVQQLVKVFFGAHPLFTVNGQLTKHTKSPMFDITDLSEESNEKLVVWNKKTRVANILTDMDFAEKREVAYYYGINPEGKTDGELTILLGSFEYGDCMEPLNIDGFISTWGEKFQSKEKEYVVMARKAITLNIIEVRNGDDGRENFYLGNTFIGTEFNDVLAYCKREERIYNENIVRGVKAADKFESEEKENEVEKVKVSESMAKELTPLEIDEMRVECKGLKVAGHIPQNVYPHLMKGDKLLDALTEGRKAKAKAEKKQLEEIGS